MRTLLPIPALLTLPAIGTDSKVLQPAKSNAAICFSLVIVAWYGVNFVLGSGLHNYGFGGGGQGSMAAAVAMQFRCASVDG